jgi:hypothetical protein
MEAYREYVGNLHAHTVYSDGTARHKHLAEAAETAGLDFVITTDHNVWVQGVEGYYGPVLLLVGEEVHNNQRHPPANHLLVYGAEQEMAPYAFGSPQTLIDKVTACDGLCFIAHPVEKRGLLGDGLDAIPWTSWPIHDVHGLEIWNYMSEFKGLLWFLPVALIYALRPDWGIRGPHKATLRLWDELLSKGMRLAALGGADAHAQEYRRGPFKRTLFPYRYLFRCVNTHVLTASPLTGKLDKDRQLIYEAIRAGHTWVGYDLPHPTRGFRFNIRSGAARVTVGEELKRLGALTLTVELPAKGEIHLRRDRKVIAKESGTQLTYTSAEPGIYRVEVYRRFRGLKVGWIFSSPIYVS